MSLAFPIYTVDMTDSVTLFSQVVLFFFGPFYGYPWKPIFNMTVGNSYKVGYKHFWAQHQVLVYCYIM